MEQAIKKGRDLPPWVQDEPPLDPEDEFFLVAFDRLSTCRHMGMGFGPIPWRDIILYAERCGLESDVQDMFVDVIRAMDAAWLEWQAQQHRTPPNKEPTKRA